MTYVDMVRGLVRPCVTLSLTALVVYLGVVGRIDPKEILAIFGTLVGFWFGGRTAANQKPEG